LSLIFLGIAFLFWRNEWIYNLPTPVPEKYRPVDTAAAIDLPANLSSGPKPLFLHFFNPDCPCSRFNMTHFKALVSQYGGQVDFVIVVLNNNAYTEKDIQRKYDLRIPVLFDSSIAVSCGVYSTPQAAILDPARKLYYRGNYNRSRYCADPRPTMPNRRWKDCCGKGPVLSFDQFALTAYGLPITQLQKITHGQHYPFTCHLGPPSHTQFLAVPHEKASDTIINYFLLFYFIAGLLFAFFTTPGPSASVWEGLSLLAYYFTRFALPGSNLHQYVLSAVLGIFMAQYIYQMHGLFEMHFFAFIGSAILITYQNWRLQIPIMVVIVLHHGIFGYLQNLGFW